MSDLIERVARRLHERQSMWPWDSVEDKQAKLTEARAAIAEVLDAMVDPGRDVIDVGRDTGPAAPYGLAETREKWQAMLAQFKAENVDRP